MTMEPVGKKYLFLDVDGVICINGVFKHDLIVKLYKIVNSTNCIVILSSDWRRSVSDRRYLINYLAKYNIAIKGHTPVIPGTFKRPKEIVKWIKCFVKCEHMNFVTLDDRWLVNEEGGHLLMNHFVHINPMVGISDTNVDQTIRILNNQFVSREWWASMYKTQQNHMEMKDSNNAR